MAIKVYMTNPRREDHGATVDGRRIETPICFWCDFEIVDVAEDGTERLLEVRRGWQHGLSAGPVSTAALDAALARRIKQLEQEFTNAAGLDVAALETRHGRPAASPAPPSAPGQGPRANPTTTTT